MVVVNNCMITLKQYVKNVVHPNMVKLKMIKLSTPQEHAVGLMHVTKLPENEGRLFVYNENQPMAFWMKNCHIPLDLAYIDENGILRELHELKPMDETRVSSKQPYRYAIETNKGWFKRNNIDIGDRVLHEI